MKLIGSKTSPFVRKIRVQLLEKDIPFEFVLEDVWNAQTRIADNNPLSKVPCLILEGGQSVFDSAVISEMLELVESRFPLLPTEPRLRALIRTMEALGDGIADAAVAVLLENRFHDSAQVSAAWIERQTTKVHQALAWVSHRLQTTPGDYLAGPFSLADVSVGCGLFYLDLRMPELLWREQYAELAAYAERLGSRPSFVATQPSV